MSDKYPRAPHLSWSPGDTKDDRKLSNVTPLLNRELVITKIKEIQVCASGRNSVS